MKTDDRARAAGSDDEPPRRDLRSRLARLKATVQERLWSADEKWAADRGWTSQRSASGWSIRARDPRFDLRQECWECHGSGRHPITGVECDDCEGTGVITLSDEPDDDLDEGGESS